MSVGLYSFWKHKKYTHCIAYFKKRKWHLKRFDIPFASAIPIPIENSFTTFKNSSFSRVYHIYKVVWILIIGNDSLTCEQEEHNENDKNAVMWYFMEMQEL